MTTIPERGSGARPDSADQHEASARGSLSPQRVLEAALRLVDERGLEHLSMRRLGAELGVEAMSLYRYFPSKDALLDGLVERLWDEVQLPDEDAVDWKAAVTGTARSLRQLAHTHPSVYPLLLGRAVLPESGLRVFDALLTMMRRGGFGPDLAPYAMETIVAYATGYAMVELSCCLGRSDLVIPTDVASRFADATRALSECNPDDQFDFGLDTVFRGLEARLRGSPAQHS